MKFLNLPTVTSKSSSRNALKVARNSPDAPLSRSNVPPGTTCAAQQSDCWSAPHVAASPSQLGPGLHSALVPAPAEPAVPTVPAAPPLPPLGLSPLLPPALLVLPAPWPSRPLLAQPASACSNHSNQGRKNLDLRA